MAFGTSLSQLSGSGQVSTSQQLVPVHPSVDMIAGENGPPDFGHAPRPGCRHAMQFFQVVHSQRSIRKFKPDPVPEEAIWKMLDAAIRAPSGLNTQLI